MCDGGEGSAKASEPAAAAASAAASAAAKPSSSKESVVIPQKYLVGDEEEALAALIACGTVNVHERAEHSGKAPIHLAAWRGRIATVQVLLDAAAGDDVDVMNDISTGPFNYGKTAIFYAITRCRQGHPSIPHAVSLLY